MSRTREGYKALENEVIERLSLPLERVSDADEEAYDARSTGIVTTTDRVPVVGKAFVPLGSPVEIKTCQRWLEDHYSRSGRRRGRWHITRSSHRELAERDGWYLLVVRGDDDGILGSVLAHALELESVVRWQATENEPYRDARASLRWAEIIPRDRVDGRVEA